MRGQSFLLAAILRNRPILINDNASSSAMKYGSKGEFAWTDT